MAASAQALVASNDVHLAIVVVGALFTFLPMISQTTSHMEHPGSPFEGAIYGGNNAFYHGVSLVSLSLGVPIFLDCVLDMALKCRATGRAKRQVVADKNRAANKVDILTDMEKLLLVVGCNVLPAVAFVPVGMVRNMALLTFCCLACQTFVVGGVVMASLCRFDKRYFPAPFIVVLLLAWVTANISEQYARNSAKYLTDDAAIVNGPLHAYGVTVCGWFVGISMSLLILVWLLSVGTKAAFGVTLKGLLGKVTVRPAGICIHLSPQTLIAHISHTWSRW